MTTKKKQCIVGLTQQEKHELRQKQMEILKKLPYGHLLCLMSKSTPKGMLDKNHFAEIHDLYLALDAILAISHILQVAQYADGLEIVFDFQSENTFELDLTDTNSNGLYTPLSNQIFIASKGDTQNVKELVAHELTHLAMSLVFQNDCRPYKEGKEKEEEAYKDIVNFAINEIIRSDIEKTLNNSITNSDLTPTVNNSIIRALSSYDPGYHEAELIVRVPHVLATHGQDEGLKILKSQALSDTLAYFDDHVLVQCQKYVKSIRSQKQKNRIAELNRESRLLAKLKEPEIYFNPNQKLNPAKQHRVFLTQAKITIAALLNLHQLLTNDEESCLYFEMKFFLKQRNEVPSCLYR